MAEPPKGAEDPNGQLGLLFQAAAAPPRRVWSVAELVSVVRTTIERDFPDVWVEGEISNCRPASSGHLYFTLKDGDAQLRIVMFRNQARLLRFKPQDGMAVIARGRVTMYEARGETQLMAEYLEPKGAGALQVAFEQLKAKLAREGLFEASRKKKLPRMPRRIGVVTSPRGAAIHDMLNILRRRHGSLSILIFPAQVQGEAAAAEVAAGIAYFNRAASGKDDDAKVDVIILARGGGSAEDLAAFNDEALARAIAASELPVVSAVGHETDFTIADFVADLRAPTPSAAAELVIEAKQELEQRVAGLHDRLGRAARYRLLMAQGRLRELAQDGAFARMGELIGRRQQRVDDVMFRMVHAAREMLRGRHRRLDVASSRVRAHDLRRVLAGMRRESESLQKRLEGGAAAALLANRNRAEHAREKLNALSPLAILERGYALVFDSEGKLVKTSDAVSAGESITARVARGEIRAKVE